MIATFAWRRSVRAGCSESCRCSTEAGEPPPATPSRTPSFLELDAGLVADFIATRSTGALGFLQAMNRSLIAALLASDARRMAGIVEEQKVTDIDVRSWSVGGARASSPELAQRVAAALEQLARERQAGAVATEALGGLQVVLAVGAVWKPRVLRGLIQRPAQRRRPLA